jgi:hypothetical protein
MFPRTSQSAFWRLLLAGAILGALTAHGQSGSAAKVVSLTGQVSILRDSAPWALHVGDLVQPRQIIVTGDDGFAVFDLSDGSKFEVFPNSRVVFRQNMGEWRDLLDLWIGRVKVYIQRLGNQPNYNKVTTPTAVISVRGTVFDVVVEDEDATTVVSVDEGAVLVRHTQQVGERLLGPGESITVYRDQPLARTLDKGGIVQKALRATAQAMYEAIYRTSRPVATNGGGAPIPGGGAGAPGGGTAPLPGDRGDDQPPPEAPPPVAP